MSTVPRHESRWDVGGIVVGDQCAGTPGRHLSPGAVTNVTHRETQDPWLEASVPRTHSSVLTTLTCVSLVTVTEQPDNTTLYTIHAFSL